MRFNRFDIARWVLLAALVIGLWPLASIRPARAGVDDQGNNIVSSKQFAPALSTYAFASVSGTATMSGYFVDSTGAQATALQSYSITSATSLTALYNTANSITSGTPLPSNFVGFRGSLSGSAVYLGNGATPTGTLTYSPGAGYPQIATQNYFTIGRV